MAITTVQEIRLAVGDTDVSLPLLTDDVYQFYLDKFSGSIPRATMSAATAILMYMSQRSSDSSVDIFSFKDSKACASYIEALKLILRDPSMNPLYNTAGMYASGISVSDIEANNANSDNVGSLNVFNSINQSTQYTSVGF
jgi:hypothetical protein